MTSVARPPRARPVRYWPGKAPQGAEEASSSDSEADNEELSIAKGQEAGGDQEIQEVSLSIQDEAVQKDRRLMRLMQTRAQRDDEDELRPGRRREREERGAEVSELPKEESEDEDEDATAARRQRIREQALKRRQEEEEQLGAQEDEEEEEGESEYTSEYTTDSEDDPVSSRTLLKPVFIPKNHRETVLEKERLEAEAQEAEARKQQQMEERKKESHDMVAEELRKEQAAAEVSNGPLEVDDTDGINEEEEYLAWKLRELRRIKRDREEKDSREAEKADIERRRNMTDQEVMAEKAKEGQLTKEKSKYRFLQKYYHKGAFFVDDDVVGKALQRRDFAEPTLEDKFDKTVLPAVMQVKNFGRAGQTKYTHLADQDTSQMDSPWFQKSELNKRTVSKLGGMKQSFSKPTAKRRKL
ncbi:uncharacterized protein SPPG_00633 [Spizellomyces punctatus DAOM BR117]|uniref:Micro-fibrillar-associated protein 1 C-terminal domain-containing protein n=1 Tax=Spizellomyces punctatus (strain DAOM BR117) TaxID=645134 RepID=A0A0L0HUZ9_SPIPD|nr:uncharacterized protein SPPG_00633 [Spizellomyces punctatus DAOM BR117]KND04943.1 hypothetical protein SPPG_00633 [Spizellomyces punctatus DAOM BR117]|eukprot:XP_016612982.1 hypothetical protein SPPG_00633 [Spizellomyces punctatus DAOM BR117]